ncbi:hypothetical protein CMT52_21085 [Elizabethkingia anophelis]|nr:hypothetical protein [Elizabethkingia anophelis]
MNCNNLEKYIMQSDFDCVGLVAKHCDLKKLCIGTEEAKIFDIIPLFCFEFVQDVLDNWNSDVEKYKNLICGGTYTDCNGKLQQNLGFNKVWVYYSYARYILVNQFNDTANGTVQKQNDFSIPTPLKEVNDISNKYRNMGKLAYESVLGYLCANKDLFPKFDTCNCKLSCGCTGTCSCGRTKKITGFKFSTVSK